LGGGLELQCTGGTREIALDDFFLDYRKTAQAPGEFLRSVIIPRRRANLFCRAYKISKRFDDDISSVCAVFAVELEGDRVLNARVAFGGMAATPKRATHCEAAFAGLDLRTDSIDAAASAVARDFQPISDARASADYRLTVAARLIKRLQLEYIGASPTRVHPTKAAGNGVLHHG
jgi:xanthine dehydrogenase small subunit